MMKTKNHHPFGVVIFLCHEKDYLSKIKPVEEALTEKGIELEINSYDTQTFAIFTDEQYEVLSREFDFGGATFKNGKAYARICTSWATSDDKTNCLINAIKNL